VLGGGIARQFVQFKRTAMQLKTSSFKLLVAEPDISNQHHAANASMTTAFD
jgi:hypothetical protein